MPLRCALLAAVVTAATFRSVATATSEPTLTIINEMRTDFYTDVETANLTGSLSLTGVSGTTTGTGSDSSAFYARGMIQTGTAAEAADGTVSAFEAIRLGSQTVASDMTFYGSLLVNDGGAVSADYEGSVHVTGNIGAATGASLEVADDMQLTLDGALMTENGSVSVLGGASRLELTSVQNLTNCDITSEGTISSVGLSAVGARNRLAGESALLHGEEGDILLSGESRLSDGARVETLAGDIQLHGANYLSAAELDAGEGSVRLMTSEADYVGSMTTIRNSDIHADKAVMLAGESGNLATVTGATSITSDGTDAAHLKSGEEVQVGMVFDNVQFESLSNTDDVVATDGDILLRNRVSLKDADMATAGTTEASRGEIVFDTDAQLELKAGGEVDARLRSVDTTASILLSDARDFVVREDSRDYNGRILADDGDGSEVTVAGNGLGTDARTILKDSNFSVAAEAYESPLGVQVGSIITVLDEGARNTEAGSLNDFLINGSYTYDDNTRAGYREIGSILNFDRGTAGNLTEATNLRLNPYTLLWEDISLNPDGSVSADMLSLSGTADAAGARVFATLTDDGAAEAAIADGTTAAILSGTMTSGFDEDVLYDMAETDNGTYQRVLRTLNVHVQNDEESGATLVFSKNFRGVSTTGNQAAVAGVLASLADTVDHTEGTLAASDNTLHRVLDALDYTRSGAAATAALQSLSGVSNTLAQHSALDGTSHHLDTLRSRITPPTRCTWDKGGYHMPERLNDAWAVYEGGYDHMSAQASMASYGRTFQGFLMGYDRQLCCNATLGIAFGYENSIARTSGARMEDDAYYIDLYSGVRTGNFDHKFTLGVGIHDFDSSRGITIAAPGHDYNGSASGSMKGHSINVGYELSYEYQLRNDTLLTPYLDVNYAFIDLNNLRENGDYGAALTTEYDRMNLVQVALGARYERHFAGLQHQERGTFILSAQAVGEFSDRRPDARNHFEGIDGYSFEVDSLKRAPFYAQLGMDVILPLTPHWDMIGGAYGRLGHDRGSITGNVGLRYDF